MKWFVGFFVGLILWTFLEYVLHRFVFHEKAFGKWAAKDHLAHHARVDWFAPIRLKLAAAVPILGAITFLSVAIVGIHLGSSLPLGTFVGWVVYEVIHRGIHRRGPIGAYGRWARRHHLFHHFGDPMMNHGVSSPVWDWVFRTLAPTDVVRIPHAHAARFPWLVTRKEASVELHPEFSRDYRLFSAANRM